MSESELDPQEKRLVLEQLELQGPMSHEELANELDYEWDEMQRIIRELRNEDLVVITIDRRYDTEANTEATATA